MNSKLIKWRNIKQVPEMTNEIWTECWELSELHSWITGCCVPLTLWILASQQNICFSARPVCIGAQDPRSSASFFSFVPSFSTADLFIFSLDASQLTLPKTFGIQSTEHVAHAVPTVFVIFNNYFSKIPVIQSFVKASSTLSIYSSLQNSYRIVIYYIPVGLIYYLNGTRYIWKEIYNLWKRWDSVARMVACLVYTAEWKTLATPIVGSNTSEIKIINFGLFLTSPLVDGRSFGFLPHPHP